MSEFQDALRDLKFEFQQLTRELQVVRQQAHTPQTSTGGSTSALVGSRRQAPGSDFLSGLSGFAISATRQVANQMGPIGSAFGNVIGGAAAGGAPGAAAAALGSAASLSAGLGRAGQEGAASAPLFSDPRRIERERQSARMNFVLSAAESFNAPFEGAGLGKPMKFGGGDPTDVKRAEAERKYLREEPADRTSASLGKFFGDIAAAGGEVSDERVAALGKVVLEQNRRRVKAEANVSLIVNHLNGTTPVPPGQ